MQCILCQNQMEKFLYKNGYWIYRCPACLFAQTELETNYLTFVRDHYSKGYFQGDPTRSAYANYELDKPIIIRNMKKFLSHILKKKQKGTLLDVGCAYGYFIELANRYGFDAYGFDASHHAAMQARKLVGADKVQEGTVSDVVYKDKSFDVITLFDVFEHLQDPIGDLVALKRFLKDDGIIVIATGNARSVAAIVFGRRWTFYIPPQHLSFFTKTNMKIFLHRVKLVPIEWFSIGKWLSIDYILHLAKTTGESIVAVYIHRFIAHLPFSRTPLYIPVKDNMVVIAKKQ